jgi:molybdopterin molybdotransferase
MLSVDEAQHRILAGSVLTRGESVALAEAVGRVPVAHSVIAQVNVPPFANSAMDGFAVRAAELPGRLTVVGEIRAGASDLQVLESGTAVRIMTGAPLPPGADAVVPQEDVTEEGESVTASAVEEGAYVRAAGHDTATGDEIVLPCPLTPAVIAVLASLGLAEVEVHRRPRVAVITTGDELAAAGTSLGAGQIHDANGPALAAAVAEAGGEPRLWSRIADDPAALEQALTAASAEADLVLVAGGVSVGRHDLVREVIERLGSLDFWRIAMQPGKPMAVGRIGSTPVIGAPGNPVSALVVTELFVRPLLRAMVGLVGDGRLHVRARLSDRVSKDPSRRAYLRVSLQQTDDGWAARPAGGQLSSQLRALADADALLIVPEGEPEAAAGVDYECLLLRDLAGASFGNE